MRRARSKYGAVPQTIDGIRFHSKKEAARYCELKLLEKAGEIRDLRLQHRYELSSPIGASGRDRARLGDYIADFRYREGPNGVLVVEDVKGFRTPLYRWKKKHVEAQYGIKVREV